MAEHPICRKRCELAPDVAFRDPEFNYISRILLYHSPRNFENPLQVFGESSVVVNRKRIVARQIQKGIVRDPAIVIVTIKPNAKANWVASRVPFPNEFDSV
nr:hypothetical protein [Burkholderia pyrrocinia]